MTRDETILRGQAADNLLANETALLAISTIERECHDAWENSDMYLGKEQRIESYRMLRAVKVLRAKLKSWSDEAKTEILKTEQEQKVTPYV